MNIQEFLDQVGGIKEDVSKIISGGPMMGKAIFSTDIPFIKTSSAILCLTKETATLPPESNCIRCGKCVSACPMGLMPLVLNQDALSGSIELFDKHNGTDCIMCGSCSYVCPASRHLAQTIIAYRGEVLASKRK